MKSKKSSCIRDHLNFCKDLFYNAACKKKYLKHKWGMFFLISAVNWSSYLQYNCAFIAYPAVRASNWIMHLQSHQTGRIFFVVRIGLVVGFALESNSFSAHGSNIIKYCKKGLPG